MKKRSAEKKGKLVLTWKHGLAITAVILIITAVIAVPRLMNNINENIAVAYVNSMPVSVDEFKREMDEAREDTYIYFKEKYNVSIGTQEFWTGSFKGEEPMAFVKKKAMERMTRIKVVQALAKKYGVDYDIKANKQNSFKYSYEEMVEELRNTLADKEFNIGDKELMLEYETEKKEKYSYGDSLELQIISVITYKSESSYDTSRKPESLAKINEINAKLDEGVKFEDVVNNFSSDNNMKISFSEKTLDEESTDSTLDDTYRAEADKINVGQISKVIDIYPGYILIKCLDKKANGFKPFEKVKEEVKLSYINKKYDELVDKLVSEAKVEIVNKTYDLIKIKV